MKTNDTRRRAEARGRLAETVAAGFLILKGYRIARRRFRAGVGEVDIVARRGAVLAFVEVKTRASLEDGLHAVSPRSRSRIVAAARAWTMGHPDDAALDLRFDVVVIVPRRWPLHIENAFGSD